MYCLCQLVDRLFVHVGSSFGAEDEVPYFGNPSFTQIFLSGREKKVTNSSAPALSEGARRGWYRDAAKRGRRGASSGLSNSKPSDSPRVALIERSDDPKGRHSGRICIPILIF